MRQCGKGWITRMYKKIEWLIDGDRDIILLKRQKQKKEKYSLTEKEREKKWIK